MDAKKLTILIIDDEAPIREILSASLRDEGFTVLTAADGKLGLQMIKEVKPDITFLDIWMPGDLDGIEVLKLAKKEHPQVEFVMISGHGTIETAVKATKLGAWDFIEKPLSMDKISIVIQNILSYQNEKEEKTALLNKLRKSIAMVGDTDGIMQTKQFITKVSGQDFSVLLHGENGVGKQLVAQNIHYMGARASRPFVEINCTSIPEDLIEAEIFGLEKGALPGVDKTRKGKIDWAQGGTLYIEEVYAMNLQCQLKLLNMLQTKKFQRVGGTEVIPSDIRIIFSSSRDLELETQEQRFRQDLMYFLKMNEFKIPSLKERFNDIPVLVSHFSDHFSQDSGYPKKVLSEKALESLMNYSWPGNIRELKNFIERVYILTPLDFIDVHDLRFAGLIEDGVAMVSGMDVMTTFRDARAQFEKEFLLKKIAENNGNISRTAEVIGLERSYLHRKIKSYGIEVP